MELKDFLRILRRNWLLILTCTLIGGLVAGTVSFLEKPQYTSQAKIFVSTQNTGGISELQQANAFGQARLQTYVEMVRTPIVLEPALDELDLDISWQQLAGQVSATAEPGTVMINVFATDESAEQAADIAQAVSGSLLTAVEDLESPANGGNSPVRLSIVTPASTPGGPSSPDIRFNLLVGLLAGLAAGIGITVLRTALDTRIRGEADLRLVTDAPVLGGIAYDSDAIKKPLLTQTPLQSPRAESFRQMRTNLQFAYVSHETKAVLVTSSIPGEGKSTTAVNLAIALAQAGQSVVLVDADLRRPRVGEYLGLERGAGLTTALIGQAKIEDLVQPWGKDELYVLTSGQIPPNPSEMLGSEAMKELILGLERDFDAVIIDAPPLLPVTDAAVLARHVGGVVVVVGADKAGTRDLEKSLDALDMVEADLLGVVLNKLPSKGPDAYPYNYYPYVPEKAKKQLAPLETEAPAPERSRSRSRGIF